MEKHYRDPETGAELTAINQVQADAFEAAGYKASKRSKAQDVEFANETVMSRSELNKMANAQANAQANMNVQPANAQDTEFGADMTEMNKIEDQAQASAMNDMKAQANTKKTK